MKKGKRRLKKWVWVAIFVLLFLVGVLVYFVFNSNIINKRDDDSDKIVSEISSHYNDYVITNKEAILFNEMDEKVGKVGEGVELVLEEIEIRKDTKYFKIKNLNGDYNIKYSDVDKVEQISEVDGRYLSYIVFNQNIVTKDKTSFYDEDDKLVYQFDQSYDFPIIILDDDRYGIEFQDKLLYVKSEDVLEKKESNNTLKKNASGVGVLNYHAFYDDSNDAEKADCVTEICHSKTQFKSHLEYFKEKDILTLTMNELEMYIDGKIQLPKSVLLTIDDGPKTKIAVDMLTEYKMYATIFLVTSWFNVDEYYKTEYIELHSHTHNLHDGGQCPGGQGGGLKCLPEETILDDLTTSREALDGSTALCYPFYEYNDYTIKLAKKAGFTMGFIGESASSDNLVHLGDDKFRLRRFVIVTYTSLSDLDKYFGQIKV